MKEIMEKYERAMKEIVFYDDPKAERMQLNELEEYLYKTGMVDEYPILAKVLIMSQDEDETVEERAFIMEQLYEAAFKL